MRILGIDPGYERVGIAILEKNHTDNKEKIVFSECFKTSSKIPFYERLKQIGQEINKVIDEFCPTTIAIEKLFLNSNQKTAMNVSESRGVIIYEATNKNLKICEYTPLQIKIAITSDGRADKDQVIFMIKKLIDITKEITHDDEYDAIATALTCFARKDFEK